MPAQDADTMQQARPSPAAREGSFDEPRIQPAACLIQLSPDWIVRGASENADDFLGESHVSLIEEPLGRFVQAQALHDLRNLFSRLSGSTGIARAYRVRLLHDRPLFDIAFQLSEGRVLLEAIPSPAQGLGESIGAVGGLIDGLSNERGDALLDGAARRMRALTGYDRALIVLNGASGERRAERSRGRFGSGQPASPIDGLPAIVADGAAAAGVPLFPRRPGDKSIGAALLRSPDAAALEQLRDQGIGSALTLPLRFEGKAIGLIQCHGRSARPANLELHAASELYAQLLALRLEVDRLRS